MENYINGSLIKGANILDQLSKHLGDESGDLDYSVVEDTRKRLERDVNTFGFNSEKLLLDYKEYLEETIPAENVEREYRDAVNLLFNFSVHWVWFFGNTHERCSLWVDGRNQMAVERCRRILALPKFQEYVGLFHIRPMGERDLDVEEKYWQQLLMSINTKTHRTLVQKTTGLMIYMLAEVGGMGKELEELFGERYYRLPLI